MATATALKPITVVPHYMRLHEWIAIEEDFFAAEGLEPKMQQEQMISALLNTNANDGRGEQRDYSEGQVCTSSACEWGVIRNAGAGKGKVLKELYSVAPYGIYVRPDSNIYSLTDLRDRPVGAMLRSGTHFTALKALEACMPRENVKVTGTGGAGHRIQMLLEGKIDAATLLDPERPIAEQMGLRKLAMGEFRVLFYVAADMPRDVVQAFIRVLKRADRALRATPAKYLPLWDRNMRPDQRGKYDYTKFGRGELLFFEPYSQELFDEGMAYAKKWGLAEDVFNERYAELTV